ncbi:MAG: hypothetical protein FD126_3733, partial [Elusimicrobia bacterium]
MTHSHIGWSTLIVSLALGLAAPAAAQDAQKLSELERKIDVLTREVERLKLGGAAEPEAAGEVPGQAPAATKVYRAGEKRVSLGGYGELSLQDFGKKRQDGATANKKDEFDFIRAVLYAGYKFNDWLLFNSELEFEHATTKVGNAVAGASPARGEVSVEQAFLDFTPWGPWLGVRAGLM